MIVEDGVFHVRFLGYTDASQGDTEPPGFAIIRSNNLLSITFENNNHRRLVIGLQSSAPRTASVETVNAAQIRGVLSSQLTNLVWNIGAGNSLTLTGGLRSDSVINVASASFH